MGQKSVAVNVDVLVAVGELGEKQIVDKALLPPRRGTGRDGVELAVDLACAGPPEEGEVEEVGQPLGVRAGTVAR